MTAPPPSQWPSSSSSEATEDGDAPEMELELTKVEERAWKRGPATSWAFTVNLRAPETILRGNAAESLLFTDNLIREALRLALETAAPSEARRPGLQAQIVISHNQMRQRSIATRIRPPDELEIENLSQRLVDICQSDELVTASNLTIYVTTFQSEPSVGGRKDNPIDCRIESRTQAALSTFLASKSSCIDPLAPSYKMPRHFRTLCIAVVIAFQLYMLETGRSRTGSTDWLKSSECKNKVFQQLRDADLLDGWLRTGKSLTMPQVQRLVEQSVPQHIVVSIYDSVGPPILRIRKPSPNAEYINIFIVYEEPEQDQHEPGIETPDYHAYAVVSMAGFVRRKYWCHFCSKGHDSIPHFCRQAFCNQNHFPWKFCYVEPISKDKKNVDKNLWGADIETSISEEDGTHEAVLLCLKRIGSPAEDMRTYAGRGCIRHFITDAIAKGSEFRNGTVLFHNAG